MFTDENDHTMGYTAYTAYCNPHVSSSFVFIADSKHLMIEQQCSTDSQWECYRTSAKHNMTVPSAMEGSEAL